jgi:hypothetical protein
MNLVLSSAFIALFCVDYYLMYSDTIKRNPKLTERQRAHILSIKASTTLFLLSIYFNYKFIRSSFNTDVYTSSLTDGDHFLLQISVLNLIAYLVTDCYVGYKKYHQYMCTLSGYTHHIVYTFISIFALYIDVSGLYFLFMIEELPTIFLSSGNYNRSIRRDNIFGLTFFTTRILYHAYLTWKFSFNKMFLALGLLSFTLHSYWFKNWFTKYFLKSSKKEKKD